MKTKLFTLLAVIFCFGGTMIHAGDRLAAITRPAGNYLNYCAPAMRACYPVSYYYPQPVYYSWGPTMVYYSSGPVTSVSSPFTNGTSVPAATIYQVPAPVIVTQPVVTYPASFGWKR